MRIIKKASLIAFWEIHNSAKAPLTSWYKITLASQFKDFNDLKKSFGQVDYVESRYIFNIGSGYRLVVAIHFNTQKVFIRDVLTHAEYDRGKWKNS